MRSSTMYVPAVVTAECFMRDLLSEPPPWWNASTWKCYVLYYEVCIGPTAVVTAALHAATKHAYVFSI